MLNVSLVCLPENLQCKKNGKLCTYFITVMVIVQQQQNLPKLYLWLSHLRLIYQQTIPIQCWGMVYLADLV